jgi:hypothetical protein
MIEFIVDTALAGATIAAILTLAVLLWHDRRLRADARRRRAYFEGGDVD